MKYIRYKYNNNIELGIILDNKIIPFKQFNLSREFVDINEFISYHTDEDIVKLQNNENKKAIGFGEIEILSPIEKPVHDIICVGLNYYNHLEESAKFINESEKYSERAVYFSKRASVINGTNSAIYSSHDIDGGTLDYECELALIIGKKGKNIDEEKALDYIFGFSILNDISSRYIQKAHGQWFKGKSLDGYTAMGPIIVGVEEFNFPLDLDIKTRINGEIRQDSNTKLMIRNIFRLIHELSQGMTLEPGDIIATGTPGGVGMGFDPPQYLKPGDHIKMEIENIGVLESFIK